MMKMTRSELIDIIHRFYPRGALAYDRINAPPGEVAYQDSEEHRRLVEAGGVTRHTPNLERPG